MERFFTSDLHFGHRGAIAMCGRPFRDLDHMHEELVRRWNERVTPEDLVYILGDFAFGRRWVRDIPRQLNGIKILVPGNHDECFPWIGRTHERHVNRLQYYHDHGLYVNGSHLQAVQVGDLIVKACHFPYDGDSGPEDRYPEYRPIDNGDWLLHGHTHSTERIRGRQVHVGVDAWDYAPVSENEILELIKGNAWQQSQSESS